MSVEDYRINAAVRRHLVSRWVDVSRLQIGTTNKVVYVMGHLDSTVADPQRRAGGVERRSDDERALRMAQLLDRELRRMPMVRDVVFKLDNVCRRGGRWRCNDIPEEERRTWTREPQIGARPHPPGGRSDEQVKP